MRLLIVSVSLAILLVGCGGGESASEAVEDLITASSARDYETAYDSLHPAHQAVVDEMLYIVCGRQDEQTGNPQVDEIVVISETEVTRTIPELGEIDVTVVFVNLVQGTETFPRTWDVVKEDGEWRWLLAEEPLNDFRAGRCPGEAASARP